ATSPAIVVPSARTHSDMKRYEVHSANRNPAVSHPWLADERAQRTISPTSACDSVGIMPRSTSSIEALKSRGIQRLTSAMEMPTKGTSDSARKKAISAAPLSASTNLAAAAFGLAQSMIGEVYSMPLGAGSEPQALHRVARSRRSHGQEGAPQLGPGPLVRPRRGTGDGALEQEGSRQRAEGAVRESLGGVRRR